MIEKKTPKDLLKENDELRQRLEEAEETLRAIRNGEVDALVVDTKQGEQTFTLEGADTIYRIAIENINEGAMTLSPEGIILYSNKYFAQLMHTDINKITGASIFDFVTPESRDKLASLLNRESGREEVKLRALDGSEVLTYTATVKLKLVSVPIVAVVTDLTQQRQSEKALAEARLLQSIMAQSSEGVILCDAKGIILHTSMEAQKLVGHSVLGKRFKDEFNTLRVDNRSITLHSLNSGEIAPKTEVTLKQVGLEKTYLLSYSKLAVEELTLGHVIILTDVTQLKQTEQKLKQNENKYRALFENMGEAAILTEAVLDAKGKPSDYIIIESNKTWNQLYNPSGTNVSGKTVLGLFPEISHDWLDNAAIVTTTGVSRNIEYFSQIFNKWLSVYFYSPQPGQVVAISNDITKRKEAEAALKESEEKYRGLFSNITEGFELGEIICDTEGQPIDYKFLDVNPAFEKMSGLSRENIIGKRVKEVRFGIEAFWIDTFGKVALTGQPVHVERYVPTVNRWLEVYVFCDQSGHFAALWQDITERKKAEESLKESEGNLNRVIEAEKSGLALIDEKGAFVMVNSAFLKMFCIPTKSDILRVNSLDWGKWKVYGEDGITLLDVDEHPVRKAAITGKPVQNKLVGMKCPNSEIFMWMVVNAEPILKNDGTLRFLITTYYDITEIKEAEEELKRQGEQLQAVNQELEAFSYSVSHDLRAPLRSLSGFSGILLEDYGTKLDDEGKVYLHKIKESSEYMSKLIDDLLKLARVAQNEISIEDLDLSEMAQKIIDELQNGAPRRRAEVCIEPGLCGRGDRVLIGQVLENLLNNAWKYNSKKPETKIEIGSGVHEGKTTYYVRDNGAGFDMTYADKLFKPFQRLHTESEFEGTGIGLAIVQRIIRRHGGKVWAEGKVGEGATFYFTLN
jgi:PAS domain S-box-containing protein